MTREQLDELCEVLDALPPGSDADLAAIVAEVKATPRTTLYKPAGVRAEVDGSQFAALIGAPWPPVESDAGRGGSQPHRRGRRPRRFVDDDPSVPVLPATVEVAPQPRRSRSDTQDAEPASSHIGAQPRPLFASRVITEQPAAIDLSLELGSGRRLTR